MRRGILLVTAFCVSFAVLWLLFCNCMEAMTGLHAFRPVVNVMTTTAQDKDSRMTFPVEVPNTCLVAEQIVMYEGAYLEEPQSDEVVSVAALLVRNTGQYGIVCATVILEAEDTVFIFEADTIPPGEAVLVLEKNKRAFGPEKFIACTGSAVSDTSDWDEADAVEIACVDMGTVTVSNRTDKVLSGIYLYYKNYILDPGFYVGGHSHMYLIERLEPGQKIYINPVYYAKGYSRFARIDITETT